MDISGFSGGFMTKNGQNRLKMAKFDKTNYFTKITLVYLCLCQIFSQIEKPKFWTELWPKMAKIGPKWPNLAKQIILLKSH